jgi:2-phosphoglycerate kinase
LGNIYIFRGKAAVGKTTLSDMLAKKLAIPVIRKDDIVDALKMTDNGDKRLINNEVCYNILYKIVQTNLNLKTDFILDIALGDRKSAIWFLSRLDFKDNRVFRFFIDCSDENEWRRRHEERIKNPLPHQIFESFEHVAEHYKNADINPFENEHIIDTADTVEISFENLLRKI